MFKLKLDSKVSGKISNFIDSYLNKFLSIFVDSWIDNVYKIEESYIEISRNFKDNIYGSLEKVFTEDTILWKKISEDNDLSVIISVWNFRLFVDYFEDKENKIRIIEDIEFYRK